MDDWQEVNYRKNRSMRDRVDLPSIQNRSNTRKFRSKEDDVEKISLSIFITNFPDDCLAKDLFNSCKQYGHVVDSFIPNKRSINGKRFGFVRFINVFNKERLVNNLSTVWIGRHKLQANLARFERTLRTPLKKPNHDKGESEKFFSSGGAVNLKKGEGLNSYVGAVMNKLVDNHSVEVQSQPAFVLDEDCLLDYDYSLALMGKVSDFGLLNNLKTTLIKEGFDKFILKYLGGFWVLIEFHSKEILEKFKSHVGVGSWFTSLEYASDSFYVDERVVWLDIEGIPMKAWTPNTFNKVSAKWGELIFVEDKENMSLNSKRICIKTKLVKNIFENRKIIIKGKVFWIRVKEVSGWVPGFMEDDDEEDSSEDDTSDNEFARDKSTDEIQVEAEIEDEVEKVSDTIFENDNELAKDGTDNDIEEGEFQSEDPFNIYPILNKTNHKRIDKEVLNTKESLEFPPGFTPNIVSDKKCDYDLNAEEQLLKQHENVYENINGEYRKKGESQHPDGDRESNCSGSFRKSIGPTSGGSILDVLEEVIKVGQTMGYKMDGCASNIVEIIKIRGENESFQ
ncbi:nucleotide-binding alpha-beta plait domain-containing protein [Tanacetum coccineum]